MQLEDWLDDLCARFIVNLPPEELVSVERICFQVEEAQWFYEDFVRPLDPSLPSLSLKAFSLRIFQHCPLFATWSMQHYTSAFAEFLAYKQRVPVRGAIMLNEDMDEVVLVKGWKKGANWSFPRGKINKDENDLDCAVREVYEETGYDIRASGLVKQEQDMKFIEVTMREQHMKLFVFRGVPKSTHFEPKTRKEISKIEWYKLTDLPTLKKKHPHHDANDENQVPHANRFYMVAPFLHPLKKWIAQQKKNKENRFSSSHLAAPPMNMDESATEGEPGPATFVDYQYNVASPAVPSSLPEVAHVHGQYPSQDPSTHLKELLNIGSKPAPPVPAIQTMHIPNPDIVKSNALLSLLRSGSTAETGPGQHASFEPPSTQSQDTQSYQPPSLGPRPSANVQQPPVSLPLPQTQISRQQSLLQLFTNTNISHPPPHHTEAPSPPNTDQNLPRSAQQLLAPYQRTGDPQFTQDSPEVTRAQVIPPANALPKLTHHTRALLDAFKSAPSPTIQASKTTDEGVGGVLAPDRQALLDVLKTATPPPQAKPASTARNNASASFVFNPNGSQHVPASGGQHLQNTQTDSSKASLLNLFRQRTETAVSTKPRLEEPLKAPVELAAGPMLSPKPQQSKTQTELLSAVLRKDAPKRNPQATRAGETAATVDGPLNQPHFESVSRSPSQIAVDSMRRSPVPAHRTLYDPKQPTPTKILQRPEENKRNQTKSPRPTKAKVAVASPKQKVRSQPEKPFQPQILKRPQVSEPRSDVTPSPTLLASSDTLRRSPSPLNPLVAPSAAPDRPPSASPQPGADAGRRTSQQTEVQKQNLLSLLTGQAGPVGTNKPRQVPTPGPVSPLSQSQLVSPLGEEPPISTRSRMSSLVSIPSAVTAVNENRPKIEKRQTAANDKAFLLGYLGRIANQEGHNE